MDGVGRHVADGTQLLCFTPAFVLPPKPGGCIIGFLLYPRLSDTEAKFFNPLSLLTKETFVRLF